MNPLPAACFQYLHDFLHMVSASGSWGGPWLGREWLVGWEGELVGGLWSWLWARHGGGCLVSEFCI